DRELVARDARHRVARAHRGLQAARDVLQELVPCPMAERIVHQLEFIQVDEQHAELYAAPARLHARLRKTVRQQRAVWQPSRRVARQPIDAARNHLALGAGAFQVSHHAAAETLEHITDRLLNQLFRAAARERRLTEMCDLGLIARLRGLLLLGALALGDVAPDATVAL